MKHPCPPTAAAGLLRRLLSGFVWLALGAAMAFAQAGTGSFTGKVIDAGKGAPLAGAIVTITGTSLETSTTRDGDFYFGTVPAGTHTVHVSYLGVPSKDFPVTVVAGERATLDAKMGEEVIKLGTFVVEGQRAGQARALNQQRASDNLRSIVSADALGRFPDQNAAESMQRITGVSLERDQGEGRFISIRGVDPNLNNTQMNGVNVPASQEDSRAVNLDVFPTDALDSIEVVKAITPDMDGDAIGGSVNIKTLTAFSSEGRILRLSAEGEYNDLVGDWGYKFAATWGDRFNDGKLGILISASQAHRYFGSDGRETDDNPWALDAGANGTGPFYTPGGDIQHREYVIDRLRSGVNVSVDFRPTPDDSFYVRGVYSHFSDNENRFRTRFRGRPANAVPTSNTAGVITNRPIVVDLKDRTEDNDVTSLSAGGEHQRGPWNIDYVLAFARAELIDPYRWQPAFQSPNTTWNYDFSDPQKPVFTGTGVSTPATSFRFTTWALDNGFNTEDELTAGINLRREVDFGKNAGHIKFGAKYRAKSRDVDIGSDAVIPTASNTLTLDKVARYSDRGVTSTFPSINPSAFRAYYQNNPGQFTIDAEATELNNTIEDYKTDEDVFAGYAMGDVALGKLTLTAGARWEHTEYENHGWSVVDEDPDTLTPLAATKSYDNFLPGIVARYDFNTRVVGRASYTNTLARPKFLDATVGRLVEDDDVTQGNPNLKPYTANNWDASLEFYPRKSLGVISVGAFYKDIKDFVYAQVIPGGGVNGGSLTTPLNGPSASVTGLEVDWQMQLSMLPSPFDGLGFYVNGTFTDSESTLGGSRQGEEVPFLNQSRQIANFALSYEKYGFFVRLSANYRSRYLSLLGPNSAGDQYVEDHLQFDLSTNYKITPRWVVYAEVMNLTDEPYSAVYNVSGGLRKAEFYSWSANMGIKASF